MAISVSALQENSRERFAQMVLEQAIWPGELLLGFTQCRLNPGTLEDRVFWVGLTQRRILFIAEAQPERSYTIYRDFVQKVEFGRMGWLKQRGLQIELGGDSLFLACIAEWSGPASRLAEAHAACELDPLYLTSLQFLQQITDLTDLGLLRIARMLLNENKRTNPVIEIEPETEALEERLQNSRLALRTGAAIFTATLVFMIVMAVSGQAQLGWSTFLMLPAVTGLLRGRQARRGFALFLALLVALGSVLLNVVSASYLNAAMWASFGMAMFLTLSGQPRRQRVMWAVAVFALGFILLPLASQVDLNGLQPAWWNENLLIPFGWI